MKDSFCRFIAISQTLMQAMAVNLRANSFNTSMAAAFFVLSQLFRMGLEAYLSQGNKKSIDIRVAHNTNKSISIDVKSVRGYSPLAVNKSPAQR